MPITGDAPEDELREGVKEGKLRIDDTDGMAYPLKDFVVQYGGSEEEPPEAWLKARIAPSDWADSAGLPGGLPGPTATDTAPGSGAVTTTPQGVVGNTDVEQFIASNFLDLKVATLLREQKSDVQATVIGMGPIVMGAGRGKGGPGDLTLGHMQMIQSRIRRAVGSDGDDMPWNPNGGGKRTGVVEMWHDKGYGFIIDDTDGTNYFCHHRDIGGRSLIRDGIVTFDLGMNMDGSRKAINVTGAVGPRIHQWGFGEKGFFQQGDWQGIAPKRGAGRGVVSNPGPKQPRKYIAVPGKGNIRVDSWLTDESEIIKYDPATEARLDEWVAHKRAQEYQAADAIRLELESRGIYPETARPNAARREQRAQPAPPGIAAGRGAAGRGLQRGFSGTPEQLLAASLTPAPGGLAVTQVTSAHHPPSAAPRAADLLPSALRVDPADGMAYSFADFVAQYGAADAVTAWARATPLGAPGGGRGAALGGPGLPPTRLGAAAPMVTPSPLTVDTSTEHYVNVPLAWVPGMNVRFGINGINYECPVPVGQGPGGRFKVTLP